MTLRENQSRFVKYLSMLIDYAYSLPEVELTLGEGKVYEQRRVRLPDGETPVVEDRVHMVRSLHYIGLAQDLNLFVSGGYVAGTHPVWNQLGAYWKSLDPSCAWGGDFGSKDYNHFSLAYGGRK